MELLFKILKISALMLFIFVLAVLCAPTLKGCFVIIHFATTLKTWLLVQLLFFGFAAAAHVLFKRMHEVPAVAVRNTGPFLSGFTPAIEPLRC